MKPLHIFRLLVCLILFWHGAVLAQEAVGKQLVLPSGTRMIRPDDNKRVRTSGEATVTLGSPVLGSGRKLMFPVVIGSVTYHLPEKTLISMGVTTKSECDALRKSMSSSNRRDLQEVAAAASMVPVSLNNLRSPNGSWAEACYNFITPTGGLGTWGSGFLTSAKKVDVPGGTALDAMMMPNVWRNLCPGFEKFSAAQRQHFIVAFVATKAMDEASCNPNAYNGNTPNPPGVGFFQLEGQARLRNARGPDCAGGHSSGVQRTLTVDAQLQCAAWQIYQTQFSEGLPFCSPGGYWQEANSMRGDICQTMMRYPGCGG